ncbi:hypothetical protein BGX29_008866 [Mortierella sp. GBA35]|nr:hypothetical protein BGX29_008866 [Mortierella sp. GBA35]
MPKHVSVELKGRIIGAHEWKHDDTIVPKKSPGKPTILGELDVNQLINKANENNRATLQEITAASPKPVSERTVRRILYKNSLFNRVAVSKPRLEPRQVEDRLAFARDKQDWTRYD